MPGCSYALDALILARAGKQSQLLHASLNQCSSLCQEDIEVIGETIFDRLGEGDDALGEE